MKMMTKMKTNKLAYFVAGGTGGHINAALALGELFQQKGYQVEFLTGKRPLDYKLFQGHVVRHLDATPLRIKNPIKLLQGFAKNFITFVSIFFDIRKRKPAFIVGAGGYVCGPTLLAGYLLGIPVYIVEQNSVMGLTNRILGNISTKIFVHFQKTLGLSERLKNKVVVSGNPIRNKISSFSFPLRAVTNDLNLLVFGGSLGAQEINLLMKELVQMDFPFRLNIRHQTGLDHEVKELKLGQNVVYEQKKYLENMAEEYQWSDLILARAGASTVSELRVVGRPVILVPYPLATDNHQDGNAKLFKEEVKFPVYIHSGKELSQNSCQKIIEIINQQYFWAKNPPQLASYHDKSTELVLEAILNDVQQ
ncbi:MAG: UDP-N-acetylglucosamine--N-acetylmuramyl-(pentapeptide) pyrophosphoryl-undecaprenol N-acetylglucosamine transferase [Bacteriovoracaceae bacterium]